MLGAAARDALPSAIYDESACLIFVEHIDVIRGDASDAAPYARIAEAGPGACRTYERRENIAKYK